MIYRFKWEIPLWIAIVAYIIFIVGSAHGDSAACFNKLSDYFKFRLEHDENYTVMYPCPQNDNLLNQTFPKDESEK